MNDPGEMADRLQRRANEIIVLKEKNRELAAEITRLDSQLEKDRKATVVRTLRFASEASHDDTANWMRQVATHIESTTPDDWWCCPMCAEVECDNGCPLEPLRVPNYVPNGGDE